MFLFIVTILACALWLTRRPVTVPEVASGVREDTDPHRAEPGHQTHKGHRPRPDAPDDHTEPFRGA